MNITKASLRGIFRQVRHNAEFGKFCGSSSESVSWMCRVFGANLVHGIGYLIVFENGTETRQRYQLSTNVSDMLKNSENSPIAAALHLESFL